LRKPVHRLSEEAFRGCCLDCEKSLEIVRPYIIGFYERIREIPIEGLRKLSLEELFEYYRLLDDIAHLPIGERLAGMILQDGEISGHLPTIRAYYKAFLITAEKKLAEGILRAEDPWGELEAFRLLPRYEALVKAYLREVRLRKDETLAFLGSGPVPFTLLLGARYGVKGIGVDVDPEAVRTSRAVVAKLGLQQMVRIVEGDEGALEDLPWDALLVAALAEPKERIFRKLREIWASKRPPHPLCYRTYTGMRAILYEPVREEQVKGFRKLKELRPPGRVNNTLVFVVAEDGPQGG